MAKLQGGLHGRPSGNVAGVVYGAARTRVGKAVTARELVSPSNPQTAAQMLQRHIFLEALYAVRHLGPAVYQAMWNRSIGQLPGFQSMMSILLDNTDALEVFSAPPVTPLGNLHFPGTFTVVTGAGAGGTFQVDWTGELGINGTNADVLNYFVIYANAGPGYSRTAISFGAGPTRNALTLAAAGMGAATDAVFCGWFVGAGTAVGLQSPAYWYDFTSHA